MKKHVMKIKIILLFAYLASCAFPLTSGAAIYKHVDKEGHVTNSNVKIKGSKKLDIAPAIQALALMHKRNINHLQKNRRQTTFLK
tara:strand:- start:210 stop:464 length:255 start_codon:yes stop_codon:yes gene_type:complete